MLAIGLTDGSVVLHDIISGHDGTAFQVMPKRPNDASSIWHLAFRPDGKTLAAAGGAPAMAAIWDLATHRRTALLNYSNGAQGIAYSPNGRTIALGTWQGVVYLWDTWTHLGEVRAQDLESWRAHRSAVADVAFSADGRTLATGSEDTTIKLWNVATHREMVTLRDFKAEVTGVGFSSDGRTLMSAGQDGVTRIYYATRPSDFRLSQ
jgi:WD40 repeat protein